MQFVDALVCSAPGTLAIERRAVPELGPGDALVRPRRVGICGTDYHIFEGKHPFLSYPRVIGHELAVEVVRAPAGSGLETGDICVVNPYLSCGRCVACRKGKPNCCANISVLGVHQDGGMTSLLRVPARNLIRAGGLTLDQCAGVEFLAIGAHAVRRAAVASDDRVLVVGAGPIGLGVALFARAAGASTSVIDRDLERAETAAAIAALTVIPAVPDTLYAAAAPSSDGFDVVFDATGNRQAMEAAFDLVAHGGRYVLVGVINDSITFVDADFHRKEMSLYGSRNATDEDFMRVMAAIRKEAVPLNRIFSHRTNLAGAAHDISVWATRKAGLIKAIVEID